MRERGRYITDTDRMRKRDGERVVDNLRRERGREGREIGESEREEVIGCNVIKSGVLEKRLDLRVVEKLMREREIECERMRGRENERERE